MSFVIYDVETTGLTKGFDQIVEFASVRTDSTLDITDEFQIRCRLMPHVIPSPEAMRVTRLRIKQLLDRSLPSHYAMVTEVRGVLESWCPTLFLGYNSLSFDEEFLRQAFYQCLYSPFLTNTHGSARADVLNLCRLTAALRPDVVKPAHDESGRAVFKLWCSPGLVDRLVKLPAPSARSLPVSGIRGSSGDVADCRTPR